MRAVLDWIIVAWVWFYTRSGLMAFWSLAWASFEIYWYALPHIRPYGPATLFDLLPLIRTAWRADRWWRLFNSFSSGRKLQAHVDGLVTFENNLDCDEFSSWAAEAIPLYNQQGGTPGEKIVDPELLLVFWREADSKLFQIRGHTMAVFQWLPSAEQIMQHPGIRSRCRSLPQVQAAGAQSSKDIYEILRRVYREQGLWGLYWHASNWGVYGPAESLDALIRDHVILEDKGGVLLTSCITTNNQNLFHWRRAHNVQA